MTLINKNFKNFVKTFLTQKYFLIIFPILALILLKIISQKCFISISYANICLKFFPWFIRLENLFYFFPYSFFDSKIFFKNFSKIFYYKKIMESKILLKIFLIKKYFSKFSDTKSIIKKKNFPIFSW